MAKTILVGARHVELTFRLADADDRHPLRGEFTCLADDYRLVRTSIN